MWRTAAAGGRRSGSLTRRAVGTGSSGPALTGRPGGSWRMAVRVAAGPGRWNGGRLDRQPEGGAKGPQIGRRAGGPAAGLFGSDIRQRPEHGRRLLAGPVPAGGSEPAAAQGPGGPGQGPLGVLLERRDAEVGQLDPAARDHHDVGRLDVVVDDPGPVGRLQRVQQLQPDPGRRRRPHRPRPLDQVAQGRRLDQLHDQEQAVAGLSHVVEDDHPGWFSRAAALASRSARRRSASRSAPGRPGRQLDFLDRHRPAKQDVLGPPHRAHPALAQRPPEDIAARDQPAGGARFHDGRKYVRPLG